MLLDPYSSKAIEFARIKKEEWDRLIKWRVYRDLDTSALVSLRVYGKFLLEQRSNPDLALATEVLDSDETANMSKMQKKSH